MVVSYAEAKEQQQPEGPPPRPNKAVYVGGLPQGATTENLSELFAKYGEVTPPPPPLSSSGFSGRDNDHQKP